MNWILRVNMSSLTIKQEEVSESYKFYGGRSFISKFLLEELDPVCEPLGPYNKLLFVPGLLGGSKIPSSGRISIGAKSPLTGGIKESNGGGTVGSKLGRLGYKAVVIEDSPQDGKKYILKISTNGGELIPAEQFWGLGVYQTATILREKFGNHVAVSCIGPAGEQQLLAAGIANTDTDGTPSRYCGRGGLGAVMGAKGIKAVIFDDSGTKALPPVFPEQLNRAVKEYGAKLKDSEAVKSYKIFGTAALVEITNALGGLPTKNFSTGFFENAEKISGESLHQIILERQGKISHACMPGCLIQCSNDYVNENGQTIVAPLEYETIALMGSNLGIDDLDTIAQLNYYCNDIGLDTIEVGAAMGVAMEAGIIPFGDKKGALELLREIGTESILGRLLGTGTATAGKVLGVKAPVVKGQAIPGYDPRAIKGVGITYATSPMGADHTAGPTIRAKIKHDLAEGQAALSKKQQYTIPIYDILGLCLFTSSIFGSNLDLLSQIVTAQLGTEVHEEDLLELAKETVSLEREFNSRAGFTNLDDRLPRFFREIPNPAVNTVFDISDEELDQLHRF